MAKAVEGFTVHLMSEAELVQRLRKLRRSMPHKLARTCKSLIRNNDPELTSIRLSHASFFTDGIRDEGAQGLGIALQLRELHPQEKSKITELILVMCGLTSRRLGALFCVSTHSPNHHFTPVPRGVFGSLTNLDLSRNQIGNGGATLISQMFLEKNNNFKSNLKQLVIQSCDIGNEGVGAIASGLASNGTLEHLTMGGNPAVTPEGWGVFGSAISRNTSVKCLDLTDTGLDAEGAAALFHQMKRIKSLESLSLGHNKVANKGAIELAKLLDMASNSAVSGDNIETTSSGPPLRTIVLHSNDIGDEGGTALANAIKNNMVLKKLTLLANPLSDGVIETFWESIHHSNKTIEKLVLPRFRREVVFYCTLNQTGRRFIGDPSLWSLWPFIFAKRLVRRDPSVLFWFIKEKPELFQRQGASKAQGRKRGKREKLPNRRQRKRLHITKQDGLSNA